MFRGRWFLVLLECDSGGRSQVEELWDGDKRDGLRTSTGRT
jgi:hypothetical protein